MPCLSRWPFQSGRPMAVCRHRGSLAYIRVRSISHPQCWHIDPSLLALWSGETEGSEHGPEYGFHRVIISTAGGAGGDHHATVWRIGIGDPLPDRDAV